MGVVAAVGRGSPGPGTRWRHVGTKNVDRGPIYIICPGAPTPSALATAPSAAPSAATSASSGGCPSRSGYDGSGTQCFVGWRIDTFGSSHCPFGGFVGGSGGSFTRPAATPLSSSDGVAGTHLRLPSPLALAPAAPRLASATATAAVAPSASPAGTDTFGSGHSSFGGSLWRRRQLGLACRDPSCCIRRRLCSDRSGSSTGIWRPLLSYLLRLQHLLWLWLH